MQTNQKSTSFCKEIYRKVSVCVFTARAKILRTLRETAALREGMLRLNSASDCRFCAKGVWKISSEKLSCRWVRRSIASFLAKKMGCASHCRFCAQGVPKMCSEKPFCGWRRRSIASFLAKEVPRKRFEKHAKSIPNPTENHPKTCPEAPSSTKEPWQSSRAAFLSIFWRSRALPPLWFWPFWAPKTCFFAIQKMSKKRVPPKSHVFNTFCDF